jgi:uridine kinase
MASKPHRAPPILIAIVGGSGSGKTWLADKLKTELAPHAARLSLDDFYRDRSHLSPLRRARINFDQPHAIDWAALEDALRALAEGRATRVPIYDFKTHSRDGVRVLHPKPVILVDGLWLLRRRSLRQLFGLRIFIDCATGTRLRRRLERDRSARGRTTASVKEQFWGTVEPMHRVYVAPQVRYADILVGGHCRAGDVARLAGEICPKRTRNARGR